MKKNIKSLAIFGGNPTFTNVLPVGQLNLPDWESFERSFRGIFSRRYYTNHGPLAQELESRLSNFFGVAHVICTTNATIALMLAAKALELKGKVVLPAYTFIATAQSLTWSGLEPVFCDVDAETHMITAEAIEPLIDDNVSAILGVHLWGGACTPVDLEALASKYNINVYFDAAHAFGCSCAGVNIGNFGNLEVFSFHATKVLNAAEGGCICTNDTDLAKRLRNIRSSYGAGESVDVPVTCNGRMSEAQAAMALLALEEYPRIRQENKDRMDVYMQLLVDIPGIAFIQQKAEGAYNYQYVVVAVDSSLFGLDRDQLVAVLEAENILCRRYFFPGVHRSIPYSQNYPQYENALPVTDMLCNNVLQLPSGALVSLDDVRSICELIRFIYNNACLIKSKL